MPRPNIKNRQKPADALFHVWGDAGPDPATASACLEEAGSVQRSSARTRFADVEPGISVREGMDRLNWEFFRPGEHVPRRKNEVIRVADNVYRYNGIVKFVIDMMADFVTQGVQIYHPSPRKEKRYRHWWRKVGGQQVSERLVNLLYRHGVAVVKRNFSVLNAGDLRDLEQGFAARSDDPSLPPDVLEDKRLVERDVRFERSVKPGRNRLPTQYTFLNPATVECVGGEISVFAGKPLYGLKIPDTLIKAIRNAKTVEEKRVIANLPNYITDVIAQGKRMIPLDPEKVSVHFYKKDDWQLWADPLVTSILKDIILYERMKDSDRAALDGAIRSVRLWRLGLPEHKIQPGPGAFKKLRDQLLANAGGGNSMDLIWDATLDFKETSTDVYRYLGSAKYEPVLQAIYAGLGIPQNLVGGRSGSMTGDALNLKTLIERLQYARNILVEFWEREFGIIQRAFGDRQPARLRFDMMTLSDEASEKMLWVQLFDRNIVTSQTIREKFGLLDDVEAQRLRREYKQMEAGNAPHKIGPFTEAQPHPDQLLKAAMQVGHYTPSEAGAKPDPRRKGEKSVLDRQDEMQERQAELEKEKMAHDQKLAERQQKVDERQGNQLHEQKLQQNDDLHRQRLSQKDAEHKATLPIKQQALKERVKVQTQVMKQKGQPGQGRPRNSKDSGTRKARTPKPRTAASFLALQIGGREALRRISPVVTEHYLNAVSKRSRASLRADQAAELERLKFAVLCSLDPADAGSVADDEVRRLAALPAPLPGADEALAGLADEAYTSRGVEPNAEELRELFVAAYAAIHAAETPGD